MTKQSYLLAEDPTTDLTIAEAMVAELEEYLIKDELYRTMIIRAPGGDLNVRMTAGDLLSRFQRLQGESAELTTAQREKLAAIMKQAETIIYSLHSRFQQRLEREMKARLDSLRWFLDDCDEDRACCRTEFPYEMRNRQRIEEILKRMGGALPAALKAQLQQIDQHIRQIATASPFIWDERLQVAFPRTPYWYLYMRP